MKDDPKDILEAAFKQMCVLEVEIADHNHDQITDLCNEIVTAMGAIKNETARTP